MPSRPRLAIVGGQARGRLLTSPPSDRIRPTPSEIREALANILRSRLPGARVLDLCAGSGSLGLELLSQGAGEALFIEKNRRNAGIVRENISTTGFDDRASVWTATAEGAVNTLHEDEQSFDIIFVDPPYNMGLAQKLLERLADRPPLLAPGGVVVVQHSRREELPERAGELVRVRERDSGETMLSFYERAAPEQAEGVEESGAS